MATGSGFIRTLPKDATGLGRSSWCLQSRWRLHDSGNKLSRAQPVVNQIPINEQSLFRELLVSEFDKLPETIITGVVESGPGGGKSPSDKFWSLRLKLVAWKVPGNQINNSTLKVSKDMLDGELQEIQTKIKAGSLVQLKVKLLEISPLADSRAELISILDTPIDTELDAALEKYNEPVEIKHPEFGILVLDKPVNVYYGNIDWLGSPIAISIHLDENNSPKSSLNTLETLYKNSHIWSRNITDYIVKYMLDLSNGEWLEEGKKELSESEFADALDLRAIGVFPKEKFEFWHEPDGLFTDHGIMTSGSLSEGVNSTELA